MPIRTERYTDEDLLPDHRAALFQAIDLLVDEWFEDIALLFDEGTFSQTSMAEYLPQKHLPRYTPQFAKEFLVCLLTVAWKLNAPGVYRLTCVAEELAMRALIHRATDVLEEQGVEADFTALEALVFEDLDVALLFAPALDGIEDTPTGKRLGIAHLPFDEWFTPFRKGEPVHPYVVPLSRGSAES